MLLPSLLRFRFATKNDVPALAAMNLRLIRDEGHRNPMTPAQIEERMASWLSGAYAAVVFETDGDADGDPATCGYCLYRRESDLVYVRHFFVEAAHRRRGVGRAAIGWLLAHPWQGVPRLRVEALVNNQPAVAFWQSVGFLPYCITMERDGEPCATAGEAA